MLKEFTKEFMTSNRGCYSREKMLNVKCVEDDNITLENLFNDLPIKDFCWFLVKKCELTLIEKQRFALHCATQVLPIFEKEHPKDKRVRECIEAINLFLDGKITKKKLIDKRRGAYDATAYAAYAAAYAAYAAYADAYAAAAYAADAAAATAYAAAFKKSVWEFIINQ